MNNKQQGFIVPLLILIIAVLVIGGGYYVYNENSRNSDNPQTIPPVSTDNSTATTTDQDDQQTSNINTGTTTYTAPSTDNGTSTASNITVSGMTRYLDTDFGFSFWHPSSWKIIKEAVTSPTNNGWFQDGSIVKKLRVKTFSEDSSDIIIEEFYSPTRSITELGHTKNMASPVGVDQKYFFDTNLHAWMHQNLTDPQSGDSLAGEVIPANITNNTMGGLHIFSGAERFGADSIVPLSAMNFLVISLDNITAGNQNPLASTIVATNPAVATPVSADKQAETITAEGLLYGIFGKRIDNQWYIYNNNLYTARGILVPGANISTFRKINAFSDGFSDYSTGFATDGNRIYSSWSYDIPVLENADPATFIPIRQEYVIPYTEGSGKFGQSFTDYDTNFSKDKSHVWYQSKLIVGADPQTFVVIRDRHVRNSNGIFTVAHDAKHTYAIDYSTSGTGNIIVID